MSGLRLKNEESKQAKRDTERAEIVSFRDVPTLRKLIAAFEGDLQQSQEGDRETNVKGRTAGRPSRQQ